MSLEHLKSGLNINGNQLNLLRNTSRLNGDTKSNSYRECVRTSKELYQSYITVSQ